MEIQPAMPVVLNRQKRFTNEDICKTPKETLNEVTNCSSSTTNLLRKMCDEKPACKGEPLVYHCVRYKQGFAEVCAPQYTITGKCCTMFDDGVGRVVEDFSRPCSDCAFKYPSNDSVKYEQCIATSETPPVSDEEAESQENPCNEGKSRNKRNVGCNNDERKTSAGKIKGNESTFYVYTIALPVIAAVIVCAAVVTCYLYHKGYSKLKCSGDDGSSMETITPEMEHLDSQYAKI